MQVFIAIGGCHTWTGVSLKIAMGGMAQAGRRIEFKIAIVSKYTFPHGGQRTKK
jgi:hypothetical protein